ncbi:MAG TPA: cytochrome P450 [Ohtaekwangia sp.]
MKTIPTRKRIPFLTDLLEIRQMTSDPMGFCQDIVKKYGDVCYVPIPGSKNYMIHDPEILREVLVTQAGKFSKSRLYRAMKRFLGEGLLTSDGSYHLQQRRLATPAFHKQRIQEYARVMVQCTCDEISTWKEEETVNISQAMTNITLQIVTHTLFGSAIGKDKLREVSENVSGLLEVSGHIFQNPLYLMCFEKDVEIPVVKKLYGLRDQLDEVILRIISDHRRTLQDDHSSLLAMLMTAKDEETGTTMTDVQLRDEVVTMFIAGHETTATALAWTWYMLGKNPDVEKKFYEEVKEKIGDRKPTAEDYQSLVFVRNVFKETLRLYPPAWTLARQATEDVDIQGFHFPKGSALCSILYIMHRKPEYFEYPDEFRPQRWEEERIKMLPRFAYFPFGGGHRMCIGEGFAWMEGILILAVVASQYRLELPAGFTTKINPVFTLRTKDAILMKVRKHFSSGS